MRHQDTKSTDSRQTSNVRIVEDVAQAARELRAEHEAHHRTTQFHLRGLSAAGVRYAVNCR